MQGENKLWKEENQKDKETINKQNDGIQKQKHNDVPIPS